MRKLCSWTVVYCTILAVGLLMATTVQARPNYLNWWIETYPDVAKKNNVSKAVQVQRLPCRRQEIEPQRLW